MKDSSGDSWHKPRKQSQHLTPVEIDVIRVGFVNRRPSGQVARELQCSRRTVTTRYGQLRMLGVVRVPITDEVKKLNQWWNLS